ncbi:MAG TPA: hypothetical protein VJ508_12265, partial [Saprospiraceae bacterium]|nr:hypothetical protein [Saprospiraceae bacterium]
MKVLRLLQDKNGEMGKFVFGLVLALMITSCGEDIDIFIPRANQNVSSDITRLTSKLKQDIAGDIHYTVSCPCYGGQAFEFDKDLVLVVPPEFVDIHKYPCPNSGNYDLDVTVCDTKGEILIAGIQTMSENRILESRIEFNVGIKAGDHYVELAPHKQIRVLVKDPDPRERMELFYGSEDNQDWIQADGNPDTWSNVKANEWWIQQDSSGGPPISGFGYETFSDSTDWINVDVFYSVVPENQRTPVCVSLPEGFTNTNAIVFMVMRDYKSVVVLEGDSTKMEFCEGHGATPIGYRVTFIAIAEKGEGNYYMATKDAEITPNLTEELVPLRTP